MRTRVGRMLICWTWAVVPWALFFLGQVPARASSGASLTQAAGLDGGDPVSMASGAYHTDLPLLSLGGPMDLGLTIRYRSDFTTVTGNSGLETHFWWSPYESLWHETSGPWGEFVTAQIRNGDTITFKKQGGQWVPSENGDFGYSQNVYPSHWTLVETATYLYLCDPERREVHSFEQLSIGVGRIRRIEDRNGNALTYSYGGADEWWPVRIEDGLGRSMDLTHVFTNGHANALTKVVDQAGRKIHLAHEDAAADNNDWWTLRSVTDAAGGTNTFSYQGYHSVARLTRPLGTAPYSQVYSNVALGGSTVRRVVSQADAYSNATTFSYDAGTNRVTMTRPDAGTVIYEHYGEEVFPKSLTDATGHSMQFGWDPTNNRPTGVTDRIGDATAIAYETNAGLIASRTDAEGATTAFTYTPQSQTFTNPANSETVNFTFYNLTRVDYADGTHDDLVYDAAGNILMFTNRRGKASSLTYNSRGQALTRVNPAGGTNTYTYNADATLASSTDSDAGIDITTYSYDGYKRLSSITSPGGGTVQLAYDVNDRLLAIVDECGRTNSFAYDANGNRISTRDPLSAIYTNAHDLMDRLVSTTDPQGGTIARSYDALNRLASVTDRNSNTTTFAYNTRDWRTSVTDPAGKTWATAYDDEGVRASVTTPLGFITSFQTDKRGRPTCITDALGMRTYLAYDVLGRLVSVTDRLNRATGYGYDAAGSLTSLTDAVLGMVRYTRNNLGQLTRIADPLGKDWDFDYSPMGRLISRTDPLARQSAFAYDSRGRLSGITYPNGSGTAAYSYDPANNVTQTVFSGGPTLTFAYDDAGRLIAAGDIVLAYDARGDFTNSQDGAAVFGASYDVGRRLKTVSYDGQATVTYTYDERDLLTRVEDDLTGVWMSFTYDDDGRQTRIQRSNGVTTDFTYDDVGRVTRIQDGTLGDQQYTLDAEGEPVRVTRDLPLISTFTSLTQALTYDDAAQNSSAGYSYDARGRRIAAPGVTYAYDGADRLIQVGSGNSTSTLTYNDLGDLRCRTNGSVTTTYFHNYAIGLAPIVAEKEGASYKRFYVYAPEGRLLYAIDAATSHARYYHVDRIGSVLFLTDGAGAVTDAYAYDPYGNARGRTGTNDQPFTFIGGFGVRMEPVGPLYDMRARAYDPGTARFLTRDPIWPVLDDPRGLDPYAYALENPLCHIDPRGEEERDADGVYAPWSHEKIREMAEWMATLSDKEFSGLVLQMSAYPSPEMINVLYEAKKLRDSPEGAEIKKGFERDQQIRREKLDQQQRFEREATLKMARFLLRQNGVVVQFMAAEFPGGMEALREAAEEDPLAFVRTWNVILHNKYEPGN